MSRKRCCQAEHAPGCRPGRPLCRWMAKMKPRYHVCFCDAYWFPHRSGSGLCGDPEKQCARYFGPYEEEAAGSS